MAAGRNNASQIGSCGSEISCSGTDRGSKFYLWPLASSKCLGKLEKKGKNTVLLPHCFFPHLLLAGVKGDPFYLLGLTGFFFLEFD